MAMLRGIPRRKRTRVAQRFARLVAGRRRSLRFESLEARRLLATTALPFWPVAVPEDPAEGEGENTEIQFRLVAVDPDGNPITQVPSGQQFFLDVIDLGHSHVLQILPGHARAEDIDIPDPIHDVENILGTPLIDDKILGITVSVHKFLITADGTHDFAELGIPEAFAAFAGQQDGPALFEYIR